MLVWKALLKNNSIVSENDTDFFSVNQQIKTMELYDPLNKNTVFKFDEYGKFNLCGTDLYTLVVGENEYKLLKKGFKKIIHYKQCITDLGNNKLLTYLPVYHIGFCKKYNFKDVKFNCEYDLSYDENTRVVKLNWFLESNKTFNGKLIIQYGDKFSELPIFIVAGQRVQTNRTIGLF